MLRSFQPEGGTLWLLIAIPEKHKYSNKSQSFYFFLLVVPGGPNS